MDKEILSAAVAAAAPEDWGLLLALAAGAWFAASQTARLYREGFFGHLLLVAARSRANPFPGSRRRFGSAFVDEWEGETHMSSGT